MVAATALRVRPLVVLAILLFSGTAFADRPLAEIRFAQGSTRLPDGAGSQLARVAGWADKNFRGLVVLDGHATPGASAKLSLRRARIIRDQLLALGVDPDQIVISPYATDAAQHAHVTVWGTEEGLDKVIAQCTKPRGTAPSAS